MMVAERESKPEHLGPAEAQHAADRMFELLDEIERALADVRDLARRMRYQDGR